MTRSTAEVAEPPTCPEVTAPAGTRQWLAQMHRADLWMNGVSRWRPYFRVTRGELYFLRLLRQAEYWCHESRTGPLARAMALMLKVRSRRQAERLGFEVPRFVLGPGASIAHSGLLVITPLARIGARCRIHQGVTVGAGNGGAPIIGDDVFIGPNALVIGAIAIGNGAFIYPGAVCTTDVPAQHAALGVPAKIRPHAQTPWRPDSWD